MDDTGGGNLDACEGWMGIDAEGEVCSGRGPPRLALPGIAVDDGILGVDTVLNPEAAACPDAGRDPNGPAADIDPDAGPDAVTGVDTCDVEAAPLTAAFPASIAYFGGCLLSKCHRTRSSVTEASSADE